MKTTAKDLILEELETRREWLAVHEFEIKSYSQNNIATRLSELFRAGKIEGRFREGKNLKEWRIKQFELTGE